MTTRVKHGKHKEKKKNDDEQILKDINKTQKLKAHSNQGCRSIYLNIFAGIIFLTYISI